MPLDYAQSDWDLLVHLHHQLARPPTDGADPPCAAVPGATPRWDPPLSAVSHAGATGPFYDDMAEDGKSGAVPLPELSFAEPREAASVALERTLRHKDKILAANPTSRETIDEALRCALTYVLAPSD